MSGTLIFILPFPFYEVGKEEVFTLFDLKKVTKALKKETWMMTQTDAFLHVLCFNFIIIFFNTISIALDNNVNNN